MQSNIMTQRLSFISSEDQSTEMCRPSKRIKRNQDISSLSTKHATPHPLEKIPSLSNHTTTKTKSLFDLPREIRDHIYDFYLGSITLDFPIYKGGMKISYWSNQRHITVPFPSDRLNRPSNELHGKRMLAQLHCLPSWLQVDKAPHQLHKEILEQFHRLAQFEFEPHWVWDIPDCDCRQYQCRCSWPSASKIAHLLNGCRYLKVFSRWYYEHYDRPGLDQHKYAKQTAKAPYSLLQDHMPWMTNLRKLTIWINIFGYCNKATCNDEHPIALDFLHGLQSPSLAKLTVQINGDTYGVCYSMCSMIATQVEEFASRLMDGKSMKCCWSVENISQEGQDERERPLQEIIVFQHVLEGYRDTQA